MKNKKLFIASSFMAMAVIAVTSVPFLSFAKNNTVSNKNQAKFQTEQKATINQKSNSDSFFGGWFKGLENIFSRFGGKNANAESVSASASSNNNFSNPIKNPIIPYTQKNYTPEISGITAPTVLQVGQTGTWAVKASDPKNESLTYVVDWGDSLFQPLLRMFGPVLFLQTNTFTHAYSSPGTYTVKFTVSNADGLTTSSTVTVHIVAATTNSTTPVITSLSGVNTVTVGQTETVTVNAYDPENNSLTYSANWGDSSVMPMALMAEPVSPFTQSATFSHIYSSPGNYTATFTAQNSAGEQTSSSMNIAVTATSSSPTLSSVSVTPATSSIIVGGTETLTASPLDQNGAAFSGATTTFTSSDSTVATVDNTGLVTGIGSGAATITATSVSGSITVTGTASVTVTPASSTAPVITSLSGPSTVSAGQTETVTVNAEDPQNSSLSYSADWGDTAGGMTPMMMTNPFVQTATFSHIYSTPGTYTATFTVENSGGETASSTLNVTVTADTASPVISNITTSSIGTSTATTSWTTNEASSSEIFYSTTTPVDTTSDSTPSVSDTSMVTSHSLNISGLTANTTYNFVVESTDASGNVTISSQSSFTTNSQ